MPPPVCTHDLTRIPTFAPTRQVWVGLFSSSQLIRSVEVSSGLTETAVCLTSREGLCHHHSMPAKLCPISANASHQAVIIVAAV